MATRGKGRLLPAATGSPGTVAHAVARQIKRAITQGRRERTFAAEHDRIAG